MAPRSKIIQIITVPIVKIGGIDHAIMALCEDGSLWWMASGKFVFCTEMEGGVYMPPKT